MAKQFNVSDILVKLFVLNERLEREFDSKLWATAAKIAEKRATGDCARKLRKLNPKGKLTFYDISHLGAETSLFVIKHEEEARKQLFQQSNGEESVFEKSVAWQSALRWLAGRVSAEIEDVERNVAQYCALLNVGRDGSRVGARSEHELWKRRQKDLARRRFQNELARLDDDSDSAINLLSLVWKEWPKEAEVAQLPRWEQLSSETVSPCDAEDDDSKREPLSSRCEEVDKAIRTYGKPLFGKEICVKVAGLAQGTLTKHIIPELMKKRGLKNKRGAGYYYPQP